MDEADAYGCLDGHEAVAPTGATALPVVELPVLGGDELVATPCLVGQPLVVNFWAEWCEPCKDEMPALQAVHEALGEQVRFVGVDYQDRTQAALDFVEQVGVTYELLADPDGEFFDAVSGRATPQTLLVDAEGQIVYRHAGPVTEQGLTDLIAEHLDVGA